MGRIGGISALRCKDEETLMTAINAVTDHMIARGRISGRISGGQSDCDTIHIHCASGDGFAITKFIFPYQL